MLKSGISKLSIAVIFVFGLFYFVQFSFSSFLQPEWSSQDRSINYVAAQTVDNNTAPQKAQLGQSTTAPKLTGRVVDNANLLSADQKIRLIEKLKAFEDKSSDQIVVLTINSLNGENLEEYANGTFRKWGLGQADENNGVLLLIAKNDRKLRIEVGYGLEGELTDAASSLIINNVIVPEFKKGNFGQGILLGTDMIVSVLSGNRTELESRAKRNKKSGNAPDAFFYIFMTIWILLFFGPILLSLLAYLFGEKLGPGHYKWLGMEIKPGSSRSRSSSSGGWSSRGGSGGFSGGGGSSGGGGASGGW